MSKFLQNHNALKDDTLLFTTKNRKAKNEIEMNKTYSHMD